MGSSGILGEPYVLNREAYVLTTYIYICIYTYVYKQVDLNICKQIPKETKETHGVLAGWRLEEDHWPTDRHEGGVWRPCQAPRGLDLKPYGWG